MLKTHLLIALRRMRRERGYAALNVSGLALGMACVILLALYVRDEISYDRFSLDADRTVRILSGDGARTPGSVGPALGAVAPGTVEDVARIWPLFAPSKLRAGNEVFVEERLAFADATTPGVLGYTLLSGDPETALQAQGTMILTAPLARKYFGTTDVVGRTMELWGQDLDVTGVMEPVPAAAHFHPDALVSMPTLVAAVGGDVSDFPMYTYARLEVGASRSAFDAALAQLPTAGATLRAQPISAIHFDASVEGNPEPGGTRSYVWMLSLVALVVLLLASANYVSLATARASVREGEVGLRKALGAGRRELVGQFLTEALVVAGVSLGLAVVLAALAMPSFNALAGKAVSLRDVEPWMWGLGLGALWGVVGIGAGLYPALILSGGQPARTLRGRGSTSASGAGVRKTLLVGQFAIAAALLVAVAVVQGQLHFMQERDLGYDDHHVVVLDADRFPLLKEALLAEPGVVGVAGTPRLMGQPLDPVPVRPEGADSARQMLLMPVTVDYVETLGMTLAAGRSFAADRASDAESAVLLNESAARALGWAESPVGHRLTLTLVQENGTTVESDRTVVGVLDDFNYLSLHAPIEPVVLTLSPDPNLTLVRLRDDSPPTLARVEAAWTRVNPDAPFNAYPLDVRLGQAYDGERTLGRVFGAFSALALAVACIGLFGLVSFLSEQRRKEVGIRRTLGATVTQIVVLLSKDVVGLVLVACALALPLAAVAMGRWAEGFAYRAALDPAAFLGAAGLVLAVAVGTVGFQALRAATADPVRALRSE